MFNFKFGLAWTAFMVVFTLGVCSSGEGIGLGLILFLGLFWAIGIGVMVSGIKMIYKDRQTEINGDFCYGRMINLSPTGCYVNDVPELKADFLVLLPEGNIRLMTEIVGMAHKISYVIGDYFELKIYNDDINIVGQIQKEHMPAQVLEALELESLRYGVQEDTLQSNAESVFINGVEYIKR